MSEQNLYSLKLNESMYVPKSPIKVIRVPGGWVYFINEESHSTFGVSGSRPGYCSMAFVPFDNEFQSGNDAPDLPFNNKI